MRQPSWNLNVDVLDVLIPGGLHANEIFSQPAMQINDLIPFKMQMTDKGDPAEFKKSEIHNKGILVIQLVVCVSLGFQGFLKRLPAQTKSYH